MSDEELLGKLDGMNERINNLLGHSVLPACTMFSFLEAPALDIVNFNKIGAMDLVNEREDVTFEDSCQAVADLTKKTRDWSNGFSYVLESRIINCPVEMEPYRSKLASVNDLVRL